MADRYAAALYAHAEDNHVLDTVVSQMERLGQLIDSSADLRRLLASPLIEVKTATSALNAVLEREGLGKEVRDFIGVVATNRRLNALHDIVAAFAALWRSGAASSPLSWPRRILSTTCSASSSAPA
jgi:F-type H+-transporting ATPase subunit delta